MSELAHLTRYVPPMLLNQGFGEQGTTLVRKKKIVSCNQVFLLPVLFVDIVPKNLG